MTGFFEARERSFYVSGEMTDFDVAAIQDYLGKVGLRVVEKALPLTAPSLELSKLELGLPEDVFTRGEFLDQWSFKGRGVGQIWATLVKSVRCGQIPLEIRRTEGNELGVTYESAAALLELMDSGEYQGKAPTSHARTCLRGVVREWRHRQEEATTQT